MSFTDAHNQPRNTCLYSDILPKNSLYQTILQRFGANSTENSLKLASPITNQVFIQLKEDSVADVTSKIEIIHHAFPNWSGRTGKYRAEIIKKYATLIEQHRQELAELLSAENGKPVAESFAEVGYGINACDWFAAEAKRHYGQVIPSAQQNHKWFTQSSAVGPCAMITPWNFPAAMVTRKSLPALAAGCTVILRPASQTPLSALGHKIVAELAGIPEEVFQIVISKNARDIGPLMFENDKIKAVSFTGSTAVGKLLMRSAASNVKKMCMELGGLAPFIVTESADVAEAVEGVLNSKFRNMGQVCIAPNRIFVHEKVHTQFVQTLLRRMQEKLKFGGPETDSCTIGPMINDKGRFYMEEVVRDAKLKGGKVLIGGTSRPDLGQFFYEPTVIDAANMTMKCWNEETFGPIIAIGEYSDEKEMLKTANSGWHGLAAYLYSNDAAQCWRMADKIETGMLGINEIGISTVECPFGGTRESGLGREGGSAGIQSYLETKYVNWNFGF